MRQARRALPIKEAGSNYPEAVHILFLMLILLLCLLLWEIFPPLLFILALVIPWNLKLRREINERHLAQEGLRESEERHRKLVESLNGAVYTVNMNGIITFASGQIRKFGYHPEEVITENFIEFVAPEQRERTLANFKDVIESKVDTQVQFIFLKKDGDRVWVETAGRTVFDASGNPLYRIGIMRNIDEQKKSEAKLKEAMEKAEAANRAKSEFLSSMSHEFRTPLNAILGYTQILTAQSGLAGTHKKQIEIIGTSAQHLMTLINDILDLSRIEAGKQELNFEAFSLPSLVQKVFNINRMRALEKDLIFFHEEMTPLPEAVWGDERKVAQVLLNLLNNAVKYTGAGSVTFKSGYREAEDTFFCLVEDTGIGIPHDRINEIFEPFSQVRNGSGFVEGTGLGLAITQRLVRLMNGELVVESEEGKGSSFGVSVRLPKAAEEKVAEVQPGPTIIGYKGPRRRILAVDDNYSNLSLLISLFDPLGFTVDAAEDGEKGLEKAVQHRPDLILLDFMMPKMDGLDVILKMMETEELKDIKVIGISATVIDKNRKRKFIEMCQDYLTKPIDTALLLDRLKHHLGLEWEYEEMTSPNPAPRDPDDAMEKLPPTEVIESLRQEILQGYFSRADKLLESLNHGETAYLPFCNRVRNHIRKYDDTGLLRFLDSIRPAAQ